MDAFLRLFIYLSIDFEKSSTTISMTALPHTTFAENKLRRQDFKVC